MTRGPPRLFWLQPLALQPVALGQSNKDGVKTAGFQSGRIRDLKPIEPGVGLTRQYLEHGYGLSGRATRSGHVNKSTYIELRVGAHSVWLPGLQKPRARHFAQAFLDAPLIPATPDLIPAPPEPPSPRLLSAHGLRAAGRWLAPVETLEKMADLRAANTADRGRLSDAALIDLGWTADQAKQVIAALKTERARQPDKPGVAPKPPKDSPFAALAVLTAPPTPPAPPARAKRRRPRKKTAAV